MTILYPKKFGQEKPADFDGIFEWDFLFPCFPRGIQPSDFDAVVEINFRFLGFETKDEGVPIKPGQRQALENAVLTGYWTVIVCRKHAAQITTFEVWHRSKEGILRKTAKTGGVKDLLEVVRRWANWADGNREFLIRDEFLSFDHCMQCGQSLPPFEID